MSTHGRATKAAMAVAIVVGLAGCDRWQSQLASTNAAGTDSANGSSWNPFITPDGSKVVFESNASNLGPTDTNGKADVYVRDLATGETELVSVNAAGTDAANAESHNFWVSPDGTKVTFDSRATDLVAPGLAGSHGDLYVRDLTTGTTTLVSVNADGTGGGDKFSHAGIVSPDGTKVMFTSDAQNLAGPPNSAGNNAFERNLTTGTTIRLTPNGGNAGQYSPTGDAVAYYDGTEVVVRDTATGVVTPVSAGRPGRAEGGLLAFSHDGRKLAYQRRTDVTYLRSDMYVYDRTTRTTTLATPAAVGGGGSNNTPTRNYGFHPSNANLLLFSSRADNLVTNDTNGATEDVFIRDLARRTTTLVSAAGDGRGSGGSPSTEGRWLGATGKVAFISAASNLGPNDTNGWNDVYVRDPAAKTTVLVSLNAAGDNSGNGVSGVYRPWLDVELYLKALRVSADGELIAFGSDADDLGPTDSDRTYQNHDIYVASVTAT